MDIKCLPLILYLYLKSLKIHLKFNRRMLTVMGNKKDLIKQINKYLSKYKDDPFWGGELQFLLNRINALESSIAVVGQFSVGKSALLNALLGEDLLATRKIESTKILTRIRYCQSRVEAKVVLTYLDGKTSQLPLNDIQDLNKYTTFQGEEITDTLQYVDVYWPVHFLNKELVLIDTPGANSITASAFETTRAQLKTSSAIIYLFMGTKGLDAADYKLIQEFVGNKKKIFLVGTHRDQLLDTQWQEVIQEVNSKVDAQHFGQLEIVGVSSLDALQGKRQKNVQLIEQSNIDQLEKMLQQYMETREYEKAEIRSIESDLLNLLADIDAEIAEQSKEYQRVQEDQKRRYDRLVALTELEYSDVLQYGLQLLKQRNQQIQQMNDRYEQQLLQNGHDILKQVKAKYSTYQQTLKTNNIASLKVENLENSYLRHLNDIESIYNSWLQHLKNYSVQFAAEVEKAVQLEDNKFLAMLKLIDTKVSIKWQEFDAIIKQLKVQPVELEADTSGFDVYKEKVDNQAENERQLRQQIQVLHNRENELRRQRMKKESEVQAQERQEQSRLGSKPQPREITKKKGFLFWKREEVVDYDYSASERWEEEYKNIHEKYRKEKCRIEENYKRDINVVSNTKQSKQREIDELEEIEQQHVLELLGALFATISNQSEVVKQMHSQRMATIKEEWNLIYVQQTENYYKHIQNVEERYKKFIEKSKNKAIQQIQVL